MMPKITSMLLIKASKIAEKVMGIDSATTARILGIEPEVWTMWKSEPTSIDEMEFKLADRIQLLTKVAMLISYVFVSKNRTPSDWLYTIDESLNETPIDLLQGLPEDMQRVVTALEALQGKSIDTKE